MINILLKSLCSKWLHSKKALDLKTGFLRGWGLLLYASLPSCLSILNILEIKSDNEIFNTSILFFCIVPLLTLFLLIRSSQEKWFFNNNYLNLRSLIMMLGILSISTIICGLSLLIKNDYQFDFSLNGIKDGGVKAFLMSISCLILSSALFMSVFIKKIELPGIPSNELAKSFSEMKGLLKLIQCNQIWLKYSEKQVVIKMLDPVEQLEKILEEFNAKVPKSIGEFSFLSNLKVLQDILKKITIVSEGTEEDLIKKYFSFSWDNQNPEDDSLLALKAIKERLI